MWQIIDHIPKGVYLNPVSSNTHVRNPNSYFSGTNLEIVRSWRQSPPVQASEVAKRPCTYFLPWISTYFWIGIHLDFKLLVTKGVIKKNICFDEVICLV